MSRSDRLRAWRARHGITQAAVARQLEVTERTVARWEAEQGEPSIAQIALLESDWPGFLAALAPGLVRRLTARTVQSLSAKR